MATSRRPTGVTTLSAKTIWVKGVFTEEEFGEVVEVLRKIEARHPEETYKALYCDPDMTMAEAADLAENPSIPAGYEREVGTFKRHKPQ